MKKSSKKSMRRMINFIIRMAIVLGGVLLSALVLFMGYNYIYVVSHPITLSQLVPQTTATVIYDCNGDVYARLGEGVKQSTRSESFPDNLKKAVICIEDHRFYDHNGVDFIRTGKVILDTITSGHFGAGGSTITQQLCKNATGDDEVSINRKVREWIYAIKLENSYGKEEILTQYLNIIYTGKGNYGMTDAADEYFNKSVNDLSTNEAAFLAGLIKSPETYVRDTEKGNARKNKVLSYMCEYGVISQSDFNSLSSKNVSVKKSTSSVDWFADAMAKELAYTVIKQRFSLSSEDALNLVYQGGFVIHSTVDPDVQESLENEWSKISDIQSGVVILTTDGKVVGVVGGVGSDTYFNRAISAKRQPGSSIKPLAVYAPCFEENVVDNTCFVEDKEINYNGWNPGNYYDGYMGIITLQQALDVSCNTVAIQLMDCLGATNSYGYLKKMGFENLVNSDKNLALAIGSITDGVTPLEMASGYQTLANGGVWCEPVFYDSVEYNGQVIYSSSSRKIQRVFSEETAYLITDLLVGVVEDEEGTAKNLQMNQRVAAKTGTTDDYKDRWLCAYTPYYVCASWFGYDTPAYISMKSSTTQKYVRNVFVDIHSGLANKEFVVPANIGKVNVCNVSGLVATESCEDTREELVDVTKVYTACDQCTGLIDNIVDGSVGDFFSGVFDGWFGSSDTEEQTTNVDNSVYEEPQFEDSTSGGDGEQPMEQETDSMGDPLPPEEGYQY